MWHLAVAEVVWRKRLDFIWYLWGLLLIQCCALVKYCDFHVFLHPCFLTFEGNYENMMKFWSSFASAAAHMSHVVIRVRNEGKSKARAPVFLIFCYLWYRLFVTLKQMIFPIKRTWEWSWISCCVQTQILRRWENLLYICDPPRGTTDLITGTNVTGIFPLRTKNNVLHLFTLYSVQVLSHSQPHWAKHRCESMTLLDDKAAVQFGHYKPLMTSLHLQMLFYPVTLPL